MKKDLDLEYNRIIREDLPDLWDRISAALPEEETVIVDLQGKKQRKQTKIYRFAAIAAACVCAAVVIPVAVIFSAGNKNRMTSETAAAAVETAAPESEEKAAEPQAFTSAAEEYEEAAVEEAAEEYEEAPAEEAAEECEDAALEEADCFPGVAVIILEVLETNEEQTRFLAEAAAANEPAGLAEKDRMVLIVNAAAEPQKTLRLETGERYSLTLVPGTDENGEAVYFVLEP